jgi:hypothetical protein
VDRVCVVLLMPGMFSQLHHLEMHVLDIIQIHVIQHFLATIMQFHEFVRSLISLLQNQVFSI